MTLDDDQQVFISTVTLYGDQQAFISTVTPDDDQQSFTSMVTLDAEVIKTTIYWTDAELLWVSADTWKFQVSNRAHKSLIFWCACVQMNVM